MDGRDISVDFLDADPRPTFVVAGATAFTKPHLDFEFRNLALREAPWLLQDLTSKDAEKLRFRKWLVTFVSGKPCPNTFSLGDHAQWTAFTVKGKFVFSATLLSSHSAALGTKQRCAGTMPNGGDSGHDYPHDSIFSKSRVFNVEDSKLIEQIATFDWDKTSLGPLSSWPTELHQLLNVMMLDTRPVTLLLGNDSRMLYNWAYASIAAQGRHPGILGLPLTEAFPEEYNLVRDEIDVALTKAEMSNHPDQVVFRTTPTGFVEHFFQWSTIPLISPLVGCYIPATDTTEERLAERRDASLTSVRNACIKVQDATLFWRAVLDELHANSRDFPFVVVHVVDRATSLAGRYSPFFNLECSYGIDVTKTSITPRLNIHDSGNGFTVVAQDAIRQGIPIPFETTENGFDWPTDIYDLSCGFGEACGKAVVCSISAPDGTLAILTIGLNSRRPYDNAYQRYMLNLKTMLSTTFIPLRMMEDQYRLLAERTAEEKAKFSDALASRTLEASRSSARLQVLQRMLEMSDVGVFEFDPNGVLMQANESWYMLSGYKREQHQGEDSFMSVVFEEDEQLVASMWKKLVTELHPLTFEMRWKFQESEEISADERKLGGKIVLAACVPIVEDGRLVAVAGITTDMSSQKARAALAVQRAEAQQRFRRFTDIAPIAIYIFNQNKGMEYCNDKFFEISGLPPCEPNQVDWSKVVYEEDLPIIGAAWQVLLVEKRPATTHFRINRKWISPDNSEETAWCLGTSYCEEDEDGTLSIIGALVDISHFKWVEQSERLRKEEALEQKRQQENFIDSTSHEMRNPLSAVLQCADATNDNLVEMTALIEASMEASQAKLQRTLKNQLNECTEAIHTIIACSVHQKRIVDDILTLSKLDSRLLVLSPLKVDPIVVLENAVKLFEGEASKAGVDLAVVMDDSIRTTDADSVMLDTGRVVQILINLVTNAIKFTKGEETRKVTITLGASSSRPTKLPDKVVFRGARVVSEEFLDKSEWGNGRKLYIWITVSDTGCGLDAAQQERLFMRFSQAFAPRTHVKYGGSGLGLFISKELAELQGGEISVTSEAGVGSTFAFYVATRIAKADTPSPGSRHPSVDTAVANAKASAQKHKHNYSILIVEDNLVNQKVLAQQLRKAGCTVHVANHGVEAIEVLKKTRFWHGQDTGLELDVVLMDCEMPVMDGLECARKIRELQDEGEIVKYCPIIAVSANARPEQITEAKTAGMDDAIAKPFRIPELMAKIEKVVERFRRMEI